MSGAFSDLTHDWKRATTYASVFLYAATGTISRAIINPTIYLYVTTVFNAESYWVGIITACSSVPSVIAGPLLGRWADKSGKSRNLILIAHLSRVIGMLMYTFRVGPWFVCIARFVTGIATGAQSAIQANLVRGSSDKARTTVLSIYLCSRRVGVTIGPLFNIFLHQVNFSAGIWLIDQYTAPAFFMFLVGICCEIFFLFGYWDQEKKESNEVKPNTIPISQSVASMNILPSSIPTVSSNVRQIYPGDVESLKKGRSHYWDLLRHEIIALMFASFVTGFTQSAMEVGNSIIPVKFYGLGVIELSWLAFTLSLLSVIVFIPIKWLNSRVSDYNLLLLGLVPNTLGLFWPAIVQVFVPEPKVVSFWVMEVGVAFFFFGQPITWIASKTIFSKIVDKQYVGFFFGIRETVVYAIGQIMGSLWTGAISNDALWIFWIVVIVLHCLSLVLYFGSWSTIVHLCSQKKAKIVSEANSVHEETTSATVIEELTDKPVQYKL